MRNLRTLDRAVRVVRGDIWQLHPENYVVVPTNIGFKLDDGANPMGKGLAQQAARRYPELPAWYGEHCKQYGKRTRWVIKVDWKLVLFATKPMDQKAPWASWKAPADIGLIEDGLRTLAAHNDQWWGFPMAFPMLGCGMGNLAVKDVGALLRKYLVADYYTVVMEKKR